jgi:hypothetical protein
MLRRCTVVPAMLLAVLVPAAQLFMLIERIRIRTASGFHEPLVDSRSCIAMIVVDRAADEAGRS